jgi:hypothetical protein
VLRVANAIRHRFRQIKSSRRRGQEQTNRAYVPVYWIASGLLRSASRRMSIEYTLVSVCAGRRRRLAGPHTTRTKPFTGASQRVTVARGTRHLYRWSSIVVGLGVIVLCM